jgi:23S rRNA pseudouridine1911/1915/1917 synthase
MTTITVSENQVKKRLDIAVLEAMPELSRASIKKLCETDRVLVNNKTSKAGYRLRLGDVITINYDQQVEIDKIPDINLPVIYEDDDCIVINKPIGVLVHSKGAFNPEATVATFLQNRIKDMDGNRAGIVHRLDRATSGVMICAKTSSALGALQKQFAVRKTKKTYVAITQGHLQPEHAIIDMPIERNPNKPQTFRVGINGKPSVTEYEVSEQSSHYDMVSLQPKTGRTHQLRVHLASQGHPVLGDALYGGKAAKRMYLHALSLEITLPNRKRQTFTAELPTDFKQVLENDNE